VTVIADSTVPGRNVVGWLRFDGSGEKELAEPTGTVAETVFGFA
jgi:hypothetical protein